MGDFETFIKAIEDGNLIAVRNSFQPDFLNMFENKMGKRPIHFACEKGSLDVVKFLFQNKCSLDCEDANGKRPIHFACEKGNLEIVQLLFQNKCSLDCEDKTGKRPIHFACEKGNLEIVQLLFQNKCNLDCKDKMMKRPIHLACKKGNLKIAQLLFQSKCNLECEDETGKRPIHLACEIGNLEIVKLLFQSKLNLECEDKDKRRPIHFASCYGHLEVVKFLFDKKCTLECEDRLGRRPIHFACEKGNLEIVEFLFQNKCSLECGDKLMKRPIHFACEKGNLEIVEFLFQNKCSLECENFEKKRPIHYACLNGRLVIAQFLFQNKCIIECEDAYNRRPIHLACLNGHLRIVFFLFQNKCNIECEDKNKMRPIHYACLEGYLPVVKFLIQSNCDLYCRGRFGKTPMELANERYHSKCSNVLEKIMESRKKIFDCIIRDDAEELDTLYSSSILTMKQHHTGLLLLEVALQSKANKIIDYILNKLVTSEELSSLENYMKGCCQPDSVQLIQECLLYRSIRFNDSNGFHLSCLAKTINEHGKLVKSSFLELAAGLGCKLFIHSLLKKSLYNEEEWTKAKDLAIMNGHREIADAIENRKVLLKKRADKNFTWLHSAVCDNDTDMMKYILEKDLVNPNSNNEVVGTALALAHMMCYGECIEVLEKFNVDVNTQNKYSQSPLHEAIDSGTIDHSSYLLSRVKDIDRPGFMDLTGLQCAVIKGYEGLCEELLKNGADCVRYVEILQQSTFNITVSPLSHRENAITLCAKIHQKIFPCLLKALDSDTLPCSDVQSVINNEIFHVAMPDNDPKTLISLFGKSCPTVQQLVIEDLLNHFVSTSNYKHFENLLYTEIAAPKLFSNGETLLTNLLKEKNLKYSWAIINCERNKKCIVSANAFSETPLQIAIENEFFDLITPIILNCDDEAALDFNWHVPLIPLFQKLSMSNNNDIDQKLLAAIKAIIFRGGNIYKQIPVGLAIIEYCIRFREGIEKFYKNARPKDRDVKNICVICLDREVNCGLDCGHTFCMDCGTQLPRCAICNSETTNPKKLYFN